MSAIEQPCYIFISAPKVSEYPNEAVIREWLEKGDTKTKIYALKQLIHLTLNGEKFPSMLMPIIRFVLPLQDHTIKKLLLIFWEIVPMITGDEKLPQEMILVCDTLRKDLLHVNQYICGSTLRFLCKLKEPELLEPLLAHIHKCLGHRSCYVRRNAVLAMGTIYKNFDFLIPDAPELIAKFLEIEVDMSCKRNAFLVLMQVDQGRALNYLNSCIDKVHTFGASLQLIIVELVYKVCCANPDKGHHYICCIYSLMNSSSPSVRYEAAGALITLSGTPKAIKAAASCYIELIAKESDNNLKLIVLDHLITLKGSPVHERVLKDLLMDLLQILGASDVEVCRKTLNLIQCLITSRYVADVVLVLKKEMAKMYNLTEREDTVEYKRLLVRTLHSCCIRFPDTARTVIPMLLEFLSDDEKEVSADILAFIQEVTLRFKHLRTLILGKLLEVFSSIRLSEIHRSALWVLGECCHNVEEIQMVMTEFLQCIGTIPIVDDELKKSAIVADLAVVAPVQGLVMADVTYTTQSTCSTIGASENKQKRPLRGYLMDGDYFIGAALSSTLVKLTLKYMMLVEDPKKQNSFIAESMLIMASIIHLGKSGLASNNINDDDLERVAQCLKVLADRYPLVIETFGSESHKRLTTMLAANEMVKLENQESESNKKIVSHVDDPIAFEQLAFRSNAFVTEDIFELSLSKATRIAEKNSANGLISCKLNKVIQLTGFSDPVYAEAYMQVSQDDIILDVLIVNQTQDTLQGCTLEFATSGYLKNVEKPLPFILAPHDLYSVKTSVKVASSEDGIISGNFTYDVSGSISGTNVVVLNDIHIDVMNYIVPAVCTEQEFREMWQKSEWENKVVVNADLLNLNEYLMFLINATNMECVTPKKMLSGECGFLAANLYATSTFGNCVMANLCIEKNSLMPDAHVTGHVRIRADSKNLVLRLSDKISLIQEATSVKTGG